MTPSLAEYPEPALIEHLLSQYATVRMEADTSHLSPGDRAALHHLVSAARWVDRIYWKQRSDVGWSLKQHLAAPGTQAPDTLQRLLALGFGPWDVFDNDRPFWGEATRPPGGGHYPADLTRAELLEYLDRHPDQREMLLSPTTLIRRAGAGLTAEPFSDAFREELAHVAEALVAASTRCSHAGFAEFLRARAEGLATGRLSHSEALWTGVGDSPIDIAIGPYEVYDDGLLGLKASYEATVMVRHAMSNRLADFEGLGEDLAAVLPGAIAAPRERQRIAVGVYDVIFAAGSTNMGAKAVAAMLPNDEAIRREHGSRLLLFRNVISAKFTPILKPLAAQVLGATQAALVDEDAFVIHTLLHEMAHALVVAPDSHGGGKATANERLRERYSTVEECRADLVGLVLLAHLSQNGVLAPGLASQAAVTFVAGNLRVLRFGDDNDYGRAATIILAHFLRAGAIVGDSEGRLEVDIAKTLSATADLAARVQALSLSGSYDAAGALIDEATPLPPAIARAVSRIDGLPVDIEFAFDTTAQPLS